MIIGISGKYKSGKTDTAKLINYILWQRNHIPIGNHVYDEKIINLVMREKHYYHSVNVFNKAFGDNLKDAVAHTLNVSRELFDTQEFKARTVKGSTLTVRQYMQTFADKIIELYPRAWIDPVTDYYNGVVANRFPAPPILHMDMAEMITYEEDTIEERNIFIVSDVRQKTEMEALNAEAYRAKDTIRYVRIVRPGHENTGTHISETDLDDVPFTYTIVNDGTHMDLMRKVKDFLVDINVIRA